MVLAVPILTTVTCTNTNKDIVSSLDVTIKRFIVRAFYAWQPSSRAWGTTHKKA